MLFIENLNSETCPICGEPVFIAPYEKEEFYTNECDTLCTNCFSRFKIDGAVIRIRKGE